MIAGSAAQAVGRPVKFESLSVALFPLPSIELHKLEVAEDPQFGTTPFLTLETGRIYLKLRPLLTGRVEFGDITLERPRIALIQNAEGRLNVASRAPPSESKTASRPGRSSGGATGGAAAAIVSRVKVDKGLITYVAHGKGPAQTPYRVEDLDVTVTGQGTQLGFKGAFVVRPGDLTVKLADGIVALNGAKTLLEAPVRAKVGIEGKDVETLVAAAAGPKPAIAGPIKGDFALGGTLGVPRISGNVEFATLRVTQSTQACPEPKQRTLALGLRTPPDRPGQSRRPAGARPHRRRHAGGRSRVVGAHGGRAELAHVVGGRLRLDHRHLPDHERSAEHEGPALHDQGGQGRCRGRLRPRDRADEPRHARRSRPGRGAGQGHRKCGVALDPHRPVVGRRADRSGKGGGRAPGSPEALPSLRRSKRVDALAFSESR